MMKYKTGEVLYVRTTEEPVCALAERRLSAGDKRFPAEYEGEGLIIVVRRPIIAEGGVSNYVFYDFLSEELATGMEMTAMRIQRLREGQELYRDEMGPDGPAGPALVKN
jgi:hypothetical protein